MQTRLRARLVYCSPLTPVCGDDSTGADLGDHEECPDDVVTREEALIDRSALQVIAVCLSNDLRRRLQCLAHREREAGPPPEILPDVRFQVTVAVGVVPAVQGVGAIAGGLVFLGLVRGDDLADV